MPMTAWDTMQGLSCGECGKPASHYWGTKPICCQCHGGNIFSEQETRKAHEEMDSENERHTQQATYRL